MYIVNSTLLTLAPPVSADVPFIISACGVNVLGLYVAFVIVTAVVGFVVSRTYTTVADEQLDLFPNGSVESALNV